MAYSSTNPVNLVTQAMAGPKIWNYRTTEGSTIVLTATGYFTDGIARGMSLGDIVIAGGDSGGTTQVFSIGIVSSLNSTAGSAGCAVATILIATA